MSVWKLAAAGFACVLGIIAAPTPVEARIDIGPEVGIVKRWADWPENLKPGIGFGGHVGFELAPLATVGPYYLHYELSPTDSSVSFVGGVFNTVGLRVALALPVPGPIKPHAFAGVGYVWTTYDYRGALIDPGFSSGSSSGHFVEVPLGIGVTYDVVERCQVSLDAAYRPGFIFDGHGLWTNQAPNTPTHGASLMLGAAFLL